MAEPLAKKRKTLQNLRDDLQLNRVMAYFQEHPKTWQDMQDIVARKPGCLSLRALEFFCTKMAAKNNLFIKNGEKFVPVHKEYVNCLNTHKKKGFDSFRRQGKNKDSCITIYLHDTEFSTTLAQLTFFMLMDQKGILQHATDQRKEIVEAMRKKSRE